MNKQTEHEHPRQDGAPGSESATYAPDIMRPKRKPLPPKTGGERFYDGFQFIFGKAFILVATAGLAFMADQKHAPDTIIGVPNLIKKFQGWFQNVVFHNKIYPVSEKGDTAKLIGAGLVGTMTLSHGGNFFAPAVKSLENNRENIANWYNKRFGTEQDVENAHERLKDIPEQNWNDVIKGRAVAWGSMFSSMMAAYIMIGKDKKTDRYWLDLYEDKFARAMAGMTKAGEEIAATPVAQELTELQKANKTYRLGKVIALDLYATTASLIIWNAVSRMSAKHRVDHEKLEAYEAADIPVPGKGEEVSEPAKPAPQPSAKPYATPSERVMAPSIAAAPTQEHAHVPEDLSSAAKPQTAEGYAKMVDSKEQEAAQHQAAGV